LNKICIEKRIPYKYGEEFKLLPIFDVHYGHKLCDVAMLKKYLADNVDGKTYIVGGGDLLDSIVCTDKRYSKGVDGTKTEDIIDEQVDGLYKIFEPYKDKFVGCSCGNHEHTIVKNSGTNPVKRLCEKLNVPYMGYSSFFKLLFTENGSRVRTVMFYINHGYGGGSNTRGGNLTKYSKVPLNFDADCYLFGHVHMLQHDFYPYLSIVGNKLTAKKKYICICGTFKKSLDDDNTVTWEETKGMSPSFLGGLTIYLKPTYTWVDIKVES